jgi:hypothetical protein
MVTRFFQHIRTGLPRTWMLIGLCVLLGFLAQVSLYRPTLSAASPASGNHALTPTPVPSPDSPLKNGSFENGLEYWELQTTKPASAKINTTTKTAVDGTTSMQVDIQTSSTEAHHVHIHQGDLPVLKDTTYTISFMAKASQEMLIQQVIQRSEEPWAEYYSQMVAVATSWREYTCTFKAPVSSPIVIAFNVALTKGTIWFDGVSFHPTQRTPTPLPLSSSLLKNGSFENGLSSWTFKTTSPASAKASTTTAAGVDSTPAMQVEIQTPSTAAWHVQLHQGGLPVLKDTTYTISFMAKASQEMFIQQYIQLSGEPWTGYRSQALSLTTSWQEYTYTFKAPVSVKVLFAFNIGQTKGTIWLDSVSFAK